MRQACWDVYLGSTRVLECRRAEQVSGVPYFGHECR